MENKLTEIVFILDRSGSMYGLEADTVGGYNSFLKKQKSENGEALITTVLFNTKMDVVHERALLSEVSPMEEKDFTPEGCTALLDAVGETVNEIKRKQKIWKDSKPDNTIVVIITDGYENASRRYSYQDIKKLISSMEECGWKFIFLGANIDAPKAAEDIGIRPTYARTYHADAKGTAVNFETVSKMVGKFRVSGKIDEEDFDAIDNDFKSRKKK